jgi:hypothetical protein
MVRLSIGVIKRHFLLKHLCPRLIFNSHIFFSKLVENSVKRFKTKIPLFLGENDDKGQPQL